MKPKTWILLLSCMLFAACTAQNDSSPSPNAALLNAPKPIINGDSPSVSYDNLWAQADTAFLGQVSYISPTYVAADSSVMTHQIAFSVIETGFDYVGIGSGVVLTVAGQSPVDEILLVRNGDGLRETAVHNLQVGDQVVVFARIETPMHSKNGYSVLMPVAAADRLFLTADHWTDIAAYASVAAGTN